MQLKIGFVNSARELTIELDKSESKQAEIVENLQKFLAAGGNADATTVIEDARGNKNILVRDQIAYAQVGAEQPRSVGFI